MSTEFNHNKVCRITKYKWAFCLHHPQPPPHCPQEKRTDVFQLLYGVDKSGFVGFHWVLLPRAALIKDAKCGLDNYKTTTYKNIMSCLLQALILTKHQEKVTTENSPAYLMSKNSSHNDIIIARKNTGNITSFFPLTHLYITWSQIDCMSSKQVKTCLKRNTCPHGRLSKNHRHSFTLEWEICPLSWFQQLFNLSGSIQDVQNSGFIEIINV